MAQTVYAAQVHITSIGLTPHLVPMLQAIRQDSTVSVIHVWVNKADGLRRVEEQVRESGVDVALDFRPGNGIYDQWNAALDWTARFEEDRLAVVLNDDLTMPRGAVGTLLGKMLKHPQFALVGFPYAGSQTEYQIAATRGTYRNAGLGGFAWAAWPKRCARINPGYTWWYGDDDLVQRTLLEGEGVGIAKGKPVGHDESYTTRHYQDPSLDLDADQRLFDSLWG